MKRLIIVLIILISSIEITFGQVPNSFRYQAVIRNASGDLVANKLVGFEISILGGSAVGQVVYAEVFEHASNEFGIVSLNIGSGLTISGDFSQIDWSDNTYYLQVEIDIDGGDNYQFMGTSQILAVPYALQALNVTNKDDADADPNNEMQTISKSGNTVTLSNSGGSFTDEVDDGDVDPSNEFQTITKNTGVVTLSNSGGFFTLDDDDPTNEIQTITKDVGSGVVTLSNSGGTFTINDDDPQNEIQYLNLTENILTITNNPEDTNPINLSAYQGTNTDQQELSHTFPNNQTLRLTIGGGTGGNVIDIPVINANGGTFAGSIFATNLSGTNTGDMDDADVVSAYQNGFTDYFTSADGFKLDNIESNATADMTDGEIVSAYQSGFTGYFNSTDRTKLNSIEDGATADMMNNEIVAAYDAGFPQHFNTVDRTKLNHLIISQDFTVSGGHTLLFNTSGSTLLTLPTSGILANQAYVNTQISNNALSNSLLQGRIFIGNTSNIATDQTLGGDATLAVNGDLTINSINGETISLAGSFITTVDNITLVADP
ncbi:MAG: hypothetical protein DRJ10_08705, partial [Bacteroidetes bacterium]